VNASRAALGVERGVAELGKCLGFKTPHEIFMTKLNFPP
jgi:hypothetical protein